MAEGGVAEAAAQMDAVVIDVGDAEVEGLSDASEGELVDRAEGEGEGDISDGRAFDAGAGVQIAFNPPEDPAAASMDPSFSVYLYKVLKQVHPDLGVTKKSMSILNSFVGGVLERILAGVEAHGAATPDGGPITAQHIEAIVAEILKDTPELQAHAIAEGRRAIERYAAAGHDDYDEADADEGDAAARLLGGDGVDDFVHVDYEKDVEGGGEGERPGTPDSDPDEPEEFEACTVA